MKERTATIDLLEYLDEVGNGEPVRWRCGECIYWRLSVGMRTGDGGSRVGSCRAGPPSLPDDRGDGYWADTTEGAGCGSWRGKRLKEKS